MGHDHGWNQGLCERRIVDYMEVDAAVLATDLLVAKLIMHNRFQALVVGSEVGLTALQQPGRVLSR